ncbi:unnamed protein product, partial [marine sediment metagenome]
IMVKQFALIGGPCTGKTTTLKALEKEGYQVVPEMARELIEEQQLIGGDLLPWKNFELFQIEIMNRRLLFESKLNDRADIFFDTGLPTALAYYEMYGFKVPEKILKAVKEIKYDKVFLLSFLDFYELDGVRLEDKASALKTHEIIKRVYTRLGHDIITVPPCNVKERVKFIKKHI